MDEKNRNSMKLDIEAVRLSENDRDPPTESYKQISEFSAANSKNSTAQLSAANMTRDKSDTVEDGADEKMLSADEKEQLAQKDEVKFIPANARSNGDAKVEIGVIDKAFTGMTKDELMKYATDPFWIRLRWIFFMLFWLLWVAMLAAAVLIVWKAPKCSAPVALSWFKEGPLIKLSTDDSLKIKAADVQLINKLKSIDAKGVIYELPKDKTYLLNTTQVQDDIKELVAALKNTNIHVILDLTPNVVTNEDEFYKSALQNDSFRSAFVWVNRPLPPSPTKWKDVITQSYVFSQSGDPYIDLQLGEEKAKNRFKDVLRSSIELGVKGFRLANAKHFIINSNVPETNDAYEQWARTGTILQPGLGDLLKEFWDVVNNGTNGDGFLSITDNIENIDDYKTSSGSIGFDLPILNTLSLGGNYHHHQMAENLFNQLNTTVRAFGKSAWVQWPYNESALNASGISASEYNLFWFLLPGTPVGTLDEFIGESNKNIDEIQKLEEIRKTQSYQHGSFEVYLAHNKTVVAYSRLKSGNPGYFVVYNPSDSDVSVDFTFVQQLPEHLTVELTSNVSEHKSIKVPTNAVPLQPRSAVILTYAPKSA